MLFDIAIWVGYILLFIWLARKGKGYDVTTTGTVGFLVQAFAYVATYVSAVALIGFAGLAYLYGVQITLVGFGVALLGTYFVYSVFAWDTKVLQGELKARTPAHLISLGHNCKKLRVFLGIIFALFLSVYASGVIKGAAVMLVSVVPVEVETITWSLAAFVGFLVWWGGLRGVLYTEAMQGGVMLLGIILLMYAVLTKVGGPIDGYHALAALEPTARANNGFVSLSSGSQGLFVLSLVLVMSVATWAQPQMIQRHFALTNKRDLKRTSLIATIIIFILVAGTFYIAALSRLILPEIDHPDKVVAVLTDMLLPEIGQQLFTLAIISASLSTTTALYHIAASSFTEDITGKAVSRFAWCVGIAFCVVVSAGAASLDGQIIALLCTTSWSVIGATAMVPYVALVKFNIRNAQAAWISSIAGFSSCIFWYLCVSPSTSVLSTKLISGIAADLPPFLIGLVCSIPTFIVCHKMKSNKVTALA